MQNLVRKEKRHVIDEKIFGPGIVTYNNYQICSDKSFDEQSENLLEDLVQVEYENGYLIDIGWYPECDPNGSFKLYLIKDYNWDNPVKVKEVKNTDEIIRVVSIYKAYIMKCVAFVLKKDSGMWMESKNHLDEFDCAGVWAMFGMDTKTKEIVCLEVGETSNIKKELSSDYKSMVESLSKVCSKKKKFRKALPWSEIIYGNDGETRFDAKYRQISQQCSEIIVCVVMRDDNIENRYNTEIEQAWDNKAVYWYPAPTNKKRCNVSQWAEIRKLRSQTDKK